MALCFVSLRDSLSVGILCTGGGVPMVARAIDLTAFVALNFFFFLMATGFALYLQDTGIMQ